MNLRKHIQSEVIRAGERLKLNTSDVSAKHYFVEGPYTCVVLANGPNTGVGMAKCQPRDKRDPEIGLSIATFRAMRKLQHA